MSSGAVGAASTLCSRAGVPAGAEPAPTPCSCFRMESAAPVLAGSTASTCPTEGDVDDKPSCAVDADWGSVADGSSTFSLFSTDVLTTTGATTDSPARDPLARWWLLSVGCKVSVAGALHWVVLVSLWCQYGFPVERLT